MDAVAEGLLGPERADRPGGGPRRVVGVEERLQECWRDRVAGAAVVVERDRREHDGHRRRRRRGARQVDGVEVRADDVEDALVEDEARAGRDVGGRRHDERALAAVEITERRVVEQDLVVQLGRELGAAPGRSAELAPVGRAERAGDDLALHVALQEALLVIDEQLVAVEAVGQRGEAAARYAGDDVDFVEQAGLVAFRPDDLGVAQELEDAVRKGGGARAAAREREDDQVLLVLVRCLARLEAVAGPHVGLRDRRIDRTGGRGAAAEQQHQHEQQMAHAIESSVSPEKLQ